MFSLAYEVLSQHYLFTHSIFTIYQTIVLFLSLVWSMKSLNSFGIIELFFKFLSLARLSNILDRYSRFYGLNQSCSDLFLGFLDVYLGLLIVSECFVLSDMSELLLYYSY